MSIGNQSRPVINVQKPDNPYRQQGPNQSSWSSLFKRMFQVRNTRYTLLWLTGGILFAVFGKRAIQKREEEILIQDLENYLETQRKKDFK